MILVTFALPFESAAFRAGGLPPDVAVLHTGVGPATARATLENWFETGSAEFVLISGFAGSLVPDLVAGDLIIGNNVSSPEWLARARDHFGDQVVSVQLHTADQIVATTADKAAVRLETGSSVVDMESEALWAACQARGARVITLRVISDGSERDLCLPPEILAASAEPTPRGPLRLLGYLATHPSSIPGFIRFVRDCRLAQRRLADGVRCALDHFSN